MPQDWDQFDRALSITYVGPFSHPLTQADAYLRLTLFNDKLPCWDARREPWGRG